MLFDCLRVLKRCFNAYVLSSLDHYAPVQRSSVESHLDELLHCYSECGKVV